MIDAGASASLTEEEASQLLCGHVARAHKRGAPVAVCNYCTAEHGDGDGFDGCYVAWPCPLVRLVWKYAHVTNLVLHTLPANHLLPALEQMQQWTSDPRARAECGRLIEVIRSTEVKP
jgi:hypothetical protein